jgi:hypothetical protein
MRSDGTKRQKSFSENGKLHAEFGSDRRVDNRAAAEDKQTASNSETI